MTQLVTGAALIVFGWATLWFGIAVGMKRNDVADVAWGLGYVVLALFLSLTRPVDARDVLVYGLVIVWGLRLSLHIHLRNRSREEDFRYRRWREAWGRWFFVRSYLQVFLLQGALLLLIASPMLVTSASTGPPLGWLARLGALLWAIGFFFEAVGDEQLRRFKADPSNEGEIMTEGLWRYTRHPNYFGEVTLWWGVFLIALPTSFGPWALVSPVTITVLILFVSGIPMLERKYAGDPDFEAYRERTSVFFPLPPKEE